jgi:hypothetical protein
MRKLLIILVIPCLFVVVSCNSRINSNRNIFISPTKNIKYRQKETYTVKGNRSQNAYSYSKGKRGRETGSFRTKKKEIRSSSKYDKKKKRVTEKKSFLSSGRNNRRERKNSNFERKSKETKGSYVFNAKKKRVVKKKVLFFRKKKREEKTFGFRGGETKHFVKYNVFSKRKRRTVHRHGFLRKKSEGRTKKSKHERDLFDPKMGIKFKKT